MTAKPTSVCNGVIYNNDATKFLTQYDGEKAQLIVADPPYFQVLLEHEWDNTWKNADDYLDWTRLWVRACKRALKQDGLLYIFGQLGKREHVWIHLCSMLCKEMQFHDRLIWDRVVGYNDRGDSFTPQYEEVLVLRHSPDSEVYFNKDVVRVPYDEETIKMYLRDKRYKDMEARKLHLSKGKKATNIFRVPSLKGSSKEKCGHPSQKPISLIRSIVESSSRPGDLVLDPFLGSGTTAEACEALGRRWIGIDNNKDFVAMAAKRILATKPEQQAFF